MRPRGFAFGALLLLAAGALVCVLTLGSSTPVSLARLPAEASPAAAVSTTPPLPPLMERPATRAAEPATSMRAEAPTKLAPRADAGVGPPASPGEISGRVVDPSGKGVPGAYVALGSEVGGVDEDGVEREPEFEPVDSTRTDAQGGYSLSPKRTGSGIVRVEARRFERASERLEIPDVSTRQKIDFQLLPLPISVIRGFLVEPDGRLLDPWMIRTLFPDAEARSRPFHIDLARGVSWIYALTDPFCAWAGREGVQGEAAVIRPETSSFEIEVPRRAERVVTALSSSRVLGSQGWRDGDPEVFLVVDAMAHFRQVGSLEAQAVDARTDAPLAEAVGSLRIPGGAEEVAQTEGRTRRGSFTFYGPDGAYDLEVRAPGFASALSRVEIRGRGRPPARVRLHPPGTAVLLLEPIEGWLPEPGTRQVGYRDGGGTDVRAGIETGGGEDPRTLVVRGLPPGEGHLNLAGNLLRIDLPAGAEVERPFPLRKPQRLLVRFRPHAEILGGDGAVECLSSLATRTGLPVVEERSRLRPRKDGSCLLRLAAPPGDYGFRMDACGGKGIRRAVTIQELPTTWLDVESP